MTYPQRWTGIVHGQLLTGLSELGTARGDFDFPFVDFEAHRARTLVRQQRHAANGTGETLTVELDDLVVSFGNHPFVGGKLPVDHP